MSEDIRYRIAGRPGSRASHIINILAGRGILFPSWQSHDFGSLSDKDFETKFILIRTVARAEYDRKEFAEALRLVILLRYIPRPRGHGHGHV